ncbi:MAG: CsgG/HfaB family protein [Treponema sp.]|nr:CsgG/HfaB family protein [Treponema sp.]
MNGFVKIIVLGFILILGNSLISCSTLRAVYGIPEPGEKESVVRKKITSAVDKASSELIARLPEKIRIAVLSSSSSTGNDQEVVIAYLKSGGYSDSQARSYVQRMDRRQVSEMAAQLKKQGTNVQGNSYADYAIEDLEYNLVNAGFRLVDRQQIERILNEQAFQTSGEVDDDSAVNIGKLSGANAVVTISVSYADGSGRLTLKALDVQTAEIITMARKDIK